MQGWQAYLVAARPRAVDIDPLLSLVLRESYLQAAADLTGIAERTRAINQRKATIRDQAGQGNASGQGLGQTQETLRIQPGTTELLMGSIGEDAQLANLDLQNVMQRYEQILDITPNIAKAMNDAAMAAVRRMQ